MEENKITQQLFDLISGKSFDMLNDDEKKLILVEMTEEEYRSMYEMNRSVVYTIKQDMASPSGLIKDKLLSSYDKKFKAEKRKKGIAELLFLKVPLYQAAAAVVVAIFISSAVYYFSLSASSIQPRIVYQQKTDTIFVKADAKNNAAKILADSLAVNENANPTEENNISPSNHSSFQKQRLNETMVGRSIKQDNDLKQFMVATPLRHSISTL